MLDVTSNDIQRLDDTNLRELVARLARATLHDRGLPTSAVTWGGNQDAADGGVDVRVDLTSVEEISGFVPRPSTAYQVKKSDMTPKEINAEMRPRDILRPAIQVLAERKGAYIIVSAGSDLTDSKLADRRKAMAAALKDCPKAADLTTDFYDRQRLADWVNDFAGVKAWTLERVGRSMQGWRGHGQWTQASYIDFFEDEQARVFDGTVREPENGIPALTGIERIRNKLRIPRQSVRLVGLSGVGKTRLAEALFDDRVGNESLNPALVLYTDLGMQPQPTPEQVVTHLLQNRTRSILVIDNCAPDLHRRLTQLCKEASSQVSILTIEYDVREDLPEATDVFRLEAATADLVAQVIVKHFPSMSKSNAIAIAEASGGNSRIGLAIAQTFKDDENASGLTDDQLFMRLFWQRFGEDDSVLAIAESCSLLYSFNVNYGSDTDQELVRLAELVGCKVTTAYRHVADLQRRGLVQSRGKWRAILPHAIANRLAARALRSIAPDEIESRLTAAPERVLFSFARRLGLLHDSPEARRLVSGWLSPSGFLSERFALLSPTSVKLLENVASTAPEAALSAIERCCSDSNAEGLFSLKNFERDRIVSLLRRLAYDADLFNRAIALIAQFAISELKSEKTSAGSAFKAWRHLFFPFLSGTRAPLEQRLLHVEEALKSPMKERRELGVEAIRSALTTRHFVLDQDTSFGSRARDYGYYPGNQKEIDTWYSKFLQLTCNVSGSDLSSASEARKVFSDGFHSLWTETGIQNEIEEAMLLVAANAFWPEGFAAVRQAKWDLRHQPCDIRLLSLEARLAPHNLEEEIALYVISDVPGILDEEDDTSKAYHRAGAEAERLGREIAPDLSLLSPLIPQLVKGFSQRRMPFGYGLGQAAKDKLLVWRAFVKEITSKPEDVNIGVLMGFAQAWREADAEEARTAIDSLIGNPALLRFIPALEVAYGLNDKSAQRLRRAIEAGVPVRAFGILASGSLSSSLSCGDLAELLSLISKQPDGRATATNILAMRLNSTSGNYTDISKLHAVGRDLLADADISQISSMQEYELKIIASCCLVGEEATVVARQLCQRLAEAMSDQYRGHFNLHRLVSKLVQARPFEALDAFVQPSKHDTFRYPTILSMFDGLSSHMRNPLTTVSENVLMEWCLKRPSENYSLLATCVPYATNSSSGETVWTSIALALIAEAPDPIPVLAKFTRRFVPFSWSGSRAAIMERGLTLLESLVSGESQLADYAKQEYLRLSKEIQKEYEYERAYSANFDQSFE